MLEAGGLLHAQAIPEGLKVLAPQVFPALVSCSHEHIIEAHCTRTRVHTRAHSTASQDLAHTCLHAAHHLCIPCSLSFIHFGPTRRLVGPRFPTRDGNPAH